MAARKTAREKLNIEKEPKKVRLDHDFSGISAGSLMFVGTPKIIDAYIRDIPYGQTRTVIAMRQDIARRRGCDATCPLSTGMFVRIAAEAAIESMEEGHAVSDVTPFWRLLSGADKIAKRLPIDAEWIDRQRALEQQDA